MSHIVDWATLAYSTTPQVIGYIGSSNPIYRQYFSGTSSTSENTTKTISTSGTASILGISAMEKSQYNNWWSLPNLHSESIYRAYLFVDGITSTGFKINIQNGTAMRGQTYRGLVDYYLA